MINWLFPKTFLEQKAPQEIQNRYSQLDKNGVDRLLIKFMEKEGIYMAENEVKYVIKSDDGETIKYDKLYEDNKLTRTDVKNHRTRLETLKAQKVDIEKEIAEIEAMLEVEEKLVEQADAEKAEKEKQELMPV